MILLATYNGSKYIGEMIESIVSQDYQDWHLIVSDDQSTDNTREILDAYVEKFADKMTHYRSGCRFGNAQNHFMHLLSEFHDAPYIMFADQDDVWHPDKIRKTYQKMKETENDSAFAVMVHTDLRVVDQELNCIHPSFMRMSDISGTRVQTKQLLLQNVVTGCTMMLNRKAAEIAIQYQTDEKIAMHDWWIALLCSVCGKIGYLNEATIDYRQHGTNSVGAKNVRSIKHICNQLKTRQFTRNMEGTYANAAMFLQCFAPLIPRNKKKMIARYADLANKNGFVRRLSYIRYGFWKAGFLRKIGQIIFG